MLVECLRILSLKTSPILCKQLLNLNIFSISSKKCSLQLIMASVSERVKNNFEKADNYITDINQKLEEIKKIRGDQPASAEEIDGNQKLEVYDAECEQLKAEIEEWKELLTIKQIRNGRKFMRYSTKANAASVVSAQKEDSATVLPSSVDSEQSKQPKKEENAKNSEKQQENKPNQAGDAKGKGGKAKAPKEQSAKSGSNPPAVAEEVVDVGRLDFRIGKIVDVEKHPDADSLYLEKVDVGEPNPRTVVSGLVKHVPIEEMRDRIVVLLCNLKPAKMRGVTSEAMVMCASTPEKVEILTPPAGALPGDLVEFDGYVRNPDAVLNPKKKIFETVAPDLKTNGERIATYKGVPFTIKDKGVVTSTTLANVNIK